MHWRKRRMHDIWYSNAKGRTLRSLGLLLLITLGLALGLSGCGKTVVVREACPPPPRLPDSLRSHTSGNLDLVPNEMLPSRNAK